MDAEDACAAHLLQLNELTEIVRAARGDEGLIQLRLPEYLTSRKLKSSSSDLRVKARGRHA